jgi:glycosyltransferase involved in cell wall biosynthesis
VKIGIDVRVHPSISGGIAPAVRSLVSALGSLADGTEEYAIIVGSQEQIDWLGPLPPRQRFVPRPQEQKPRHPLFRPFVPAIRKLQHWLSPPRFWPEVPLSNGFYESLGCDVIHFPTQRFTVCGVRTVYNPIDLQHLHYPEFFDAYAIAWRDSMYRMGCRLARTLIVNSEWIKEDLIRHYQVDPSKIMVVAEAPPAAGTRELSDAALNEVRSKYQLDRPFILYPAVTWPHKNHLRLFKALAHLRDRRRLEPQLVCTGSKFEPFWPSIEQGLRENALGSQVKFLGHVPNEDLRALYRLSTCMTLPSLFEANSLPIFEAWRDGTPVACANATGLPEQVDNAALLFDPENCVAIADALAALMTDSTLRATLRERGRRRGAQFTWEQTARAYRAVYRKTAGVELTDEDRFLLSSAARRPERFVPQLSNLVS